MFKFFRKNMKTIIVATAVIFAASIFYGIASYRKGQTPEGKYKYPLKVNGKGMPYKRFNQLFLKLKESFPQRLKTKELLLLQNLTLGQAIDFMILLEDAKKREKVSNRELNQILNSIAAQQKFPSVKELREAMEKQNISWREFKNMVKEEILVQKLVKSIKGQEKITPNDLKEIRARHVLIAIKPGKEKESRELAQEIYDRAKKGEDFSELAKKYSEDPGTKEKGGDLGYFTTGMMVKPFENLVFSLKKGEIGGPIKTEFGYHVVKVEDIRLRKVEGKQMKDLENEILRQKQDKAFREYFFKLKEKAKIEIIDPSLKASNLRFKGRLNDAAKAYEEAIAVQPQNPFLFAFYGSLLEDMGKTELAVAQYEEAVKRDSTNISFHMLLAEAYLKIDKKTKAEESFKKASMLAGDDKVFHDELLKLFEEKKLYALVEYEKKVLQDIMMKRLLDEKLKKEIEAKEKIKSE